MSESQMLVFHWFYKGNRAGDETQWVIPESRVLIFHWFYKQNRAGDASGVHAIAADHVRKQNHWFYV